ncbi:MAG TPA: anti-sigma factor [Sphingomicrobium sp.]|nr:anti-sigma factor [Sphingomicrobium sp.]
MSEDEQFYAWLDGELDTETAAEVAARVAADPALTRLAEQHRALNSTLRNAFEPIASSPVPEQLLAAARTQGTVADFAAAREKRRAPPRFGLPQWGAIAATLVVGVITGTMLQSGNTSPVEASNGRLVAAAGLGKALDVQLASAAQSGPLRVGLTFRDGSGAICRSFIDTGSSGLACHNRGQWQIRGLFAAPEGSRGDYRMAAGADPALAALIDSTIAGDPFDANQERAAKDRGWR